MQPSSYNPYLGDQQATEDLQSILTQEEFKSYRAILSRQHEKLEQLAIEIMKSPKPTLVENVGYPNAYVGRLVEAIHELFMYLRTAKCFADTEPRAVAGRIWTRLLKDTETFLSIYRRRYNLVPGRSWMHSEEELTAQGLRTWAAAFCKSAIEIALSNAFKEISNRDGVVSERPIENCVEPSADSVISRILDGSARDTGESTKKVVHTPQTRAEAARRLKMVVDYIEEVFKKTGKIINLTDIWKATRYESRTEFDRWKNCFYERHGRKTNGSANDTFTKLLLLEKPHLR